MLPLGGKEQREGKSIYPIYVGHNGACGVGGGVGSEDKNNSGKKSS